MLRYYNWSLDGLPFANCRPPYGEGRQVKPAEHMAKATGSLKPVFSVPVLQPRGHRPGASLEKKFARYPHFMVWLKAKKSATLLPAAIYPALCMPRKPTHKTFRLNALIDGHLIAGVVRFSPAPAPGILTEIARRDAERVLARLVTEAIAAGRL
jgi:hypothetical protein